MSYRRELVRAGIHIICEHLIAVLLKLKKQRKRQMWKQWILRQNGLMHAECSAEGADDNPETSMNHQASDGLQEKLRPIHSRPSQEGQNNCSTMVLRSSRRFKTEEVCAGDVNPEIFNQDKPIKDVNIKREIKQEVEDIPESPCNDDGANNSYANSSPSDSVHKLEDGQQFAALCEVYMSPSPVNSHNRPCDNFNDSFATGATTTQKMRRMKKEVASLRKQLANLESGLRKFLCEDQLLFLRHKSHSREFVWSEATIRKAKKIQVACGVKGYNCLREMGFPLPGKSTVAKKIKQFGVKHA